MLTFVQINLIKLKVAFYQVCVMFSFSLSPLLWNSEYFWKRLFRIKRWARLSVLLFPFYRFVFSLLLPFPVLKLFLTVRLPLFFFILPQGVYFHASNPKDFIGFCWDCSREEGFARSDCMVLARVHSVLRST